MPNLTEVTVLIIFLLAILYFVWIWYFATQEAEDLEDELLQIRKKEITYPVLRALRDEYKLYTMGMNKSKHTMTYEEWLENRIVIEGPDK